MGPGDLDRLLGDVRLPRDERVLIGLDCPDDAAVFLIEEGLALVQTVDLISPIADDPKDFGAIAAANALSDVYAMGGRPISALAIFAFPVGREKDETFRGILEGAAEKMAEAGAFIVGGHTVDDPELKFGLAVTGIADPNRLIIKGGARPKDLLVLTKPIGTGVISTALKRGEALEDHVAEAIRSMKTLNRAAGLAAVATSLRGGTDVTGFGLLGHLREMVLSASLGAEVSLHSVPLLPGALEYARKGLFPGGTKRNQAFVSCLVDGGESFDPALLTLLYDAQTSGGLLLAVPEEGLKDFCRAFEDYGGDPQNLAVIGRFVEMQKPRIRLVP